MAHHDLGEMDESFKPLAQAIGRAVLGAAVLEKVLLVDIARRRVVQTSTVAALNFLTVRRLRDLLGVASNLKSCKMQLMHRHAVLGCYDD